MTFWIQVFIAIAALVVVMQMLSAILESNPFLQRIVLGTVLLLALLWTWMHVAELIRFAKASLH